MPRNSRRFDSLGAACTVALDLSAASPRLTRSLNSTLKRTNCISGPFDESFVHIVKILGAIDRVSLSVAYTIGIHLGGIPHWSVIASNRGAHKPVRAVRRVRVVCVSVCVGAARARRWGAGGAWSPARLAGLARRLLPAACSPHGGASPPYTRGNRQQSLLYRVPIGITGYISMNDYKSLNLTDGTFLVNQFLSNRTTLTLHSAACFSVCTCTYNIISTLIAMFLGFDYYYLNWLLMPVFSCIHSRQLINLYNYESTKVKY